MSINTARLPRSLRFSPFSLIAGSIRYVVIFWLIGYVVAVVGAPLAIDYWGEVTSSIWQHTAFMVPRWFALAFAIYIGYMQLPLWVTHGQTRREFSVQAVTFILAFSATLAALITAGFVLEAGLYAVADWPQALGGGHLYDSPWQLHLIFVESWLVQALWAAVGMFIGTAFYRSKLIGALAVASSVAIAYFASAAFGSDWTPWIPMYVIGTMIILALMWLIVRDVPIRAKAT
jgi:hypothetical protein